MLSARGRHFKGRQGEDGAVEGRGVERRTRCWWHGQQQLLSVPLGGTNSIGFLSQHTPRQATVGPVPAWTPSPKTMKLFLSMEDHLPPRTHRGSFRGPVHFVHRAPGKLVPMLSRSQRGEEIGLLTVLTQVRTVLGKRSQCAGLCPPHLLRQVFFLVSIF